MKLLRTIRLDPSDSFVFEHAAEPGEWALCGTFMFADQDPTQLEGKARSAFRSGFLGLESFGWSTLAQIVETDSGTREKLVHRLAERLLSDFDAPDFAAAQGAAEEEIAFVASLCDQPADTLIALSRTYEDGSIRESFRSLRPRPGGSPKPVFSFVEVEGEEADGSDQVDLVQLAQGERK